MSNFITGCIRGECLLDDVEDYVSTWHASTSEIPLHRYLGMSKSEYSLWVVDPDVLPFIVQAHKLERNVADLIQEFEAMPMAARANSPTEARKLMQWLKREGLWE